MNILFLNPRPLYESWPIPNDFWRHFTNVIGATYPQLAATIKDIDGVTCTIFNGFAEKITFKKYCTLLSEFDIICLGAVSSVDALNIELSITLIKTISPNTTVILGGHHATAYAKEWIQKGADIIIKKEGEISFKETIRALKRKTMLSTIKGIAYRDSSGKFVKTDDQQLIQDLDTLPFPEWDLIDFNQYVNTFSDGNKTIFLETARGCTFNCSFCCTSWMWNRTQRYKSVQRVLKEMHYVYEKGVRTIAIADDNFGSNYERDTAILKEIIKSKMDIHLWMFCRADTILKHDDFVKLAAKAGLIEIFVGFESLQPHSLKDYNKGLSHLSSPRDYLTVYNKLRAENIMVFGSFVTEPPNKNKPENQSLKASHICDIAMHQEVIPMKQITLYKTLQEKIKEGYDSFYSDKLLNPYKITSSHFIKSLSGILNLNIAKTIFAVHPRTYREKKRIIKIYWHILRYALHLSFTKLTIMLYVFHPTYSISQKQTYIKTVYSKKTVKKINSYLKKKHNNENRTNLSQNILANA